MSLPESWTLDNPPDAPWTPRYLAAIELAIAAGNSTLPMFHRRDFAVQRKADRSPVTAADQKAERLIRDAVQSRFPGDAILGEEFGEQPGEGDYRWIIDPIDGTKSFITGVPLYSTLVAVNYKNAPLVGIIYMPALGAIAVAAVGHGAWMNQDGGCVRARVSEVDSLDDAAFVTTQRDSFDVVSGTRLFELFEQRCAVTRTWGDGYGYYLVATGRAELMIDPIVNAWDVAAVAPVIVEAGGRCTDWNFEPRLDSGNAIATNGRLFEAVRTLSRNSSVV